LKYCVVITDGAAGWPLPGYNNQTCLELARTPNLDTMAAAGTVGLVRTVPPGMEPSSACACMSVLGFDPRVYYKGRASIEAKSIGVPLGADEVVFRCNVVTVKDGRMLDYSAGHIPTAEAQQLIQALNDSLGNDEVKFYPGTSYRHILKLKGHQDTLQADCTPPHDIPDKPVASYLPQGPGSDFLLELMQRSRAILSEHPVNAARRARGEAEATTIWLFWGSASLPATPSFKETYGLSAALTSGVDLLRGLAQMFTMDILQIPGVTDGPDNDYMAQAAGALGSLRNHDLVVIHVEAPDEAGHAGSVTEKVAALEMVDSEIIRRLLDYHGEMRVLVMPDHPTPIALRTHCPDPVPFLIWGAGIKPNGARRFTEPEAQTGLFLDPGYNIMSKLLR
jgi:2,3-bisphosphoglycerate-independent phosphoglycerate mutase